MQIVEGARAVLRPRLLSLLPRERGRSPGMTNNIGTEARPGAPR